MINSLAPLTFALVAAVAPAGRGEPESARWETAATPVSLCVAAASSADCPDAGARPPQQAPPQGEKPPPEKSDARKEGTTGEQVRRYVDERSPKLADWLFGTGSRTSGYADEPLRNRGLRSLPPASGEPRMSNDVTELEDLGFVIAGAEPKIVYIVSLLPAAVGAHVDVRPNDVIVTLNGHAVDTPQTFRNRYGRLRNGQPVELVLRRGEHRVTVAFYKPAPEPLREPDRTRRPGSDRQGPGFPR